MISHLMKSTAIAAMLATGAAPALAASATTNLTVTATVADTCVVAATAMAFATLDASGATDESTPGAIVVTCTSAKVGLTVALNGGANRSDTQRRMSDGGTNFVPYNIYSDSSHSSLVAVDANIFSGNIPAATPTTIDVYGQVPAGDYNAGTYLDTVLVTVTY